ncbi:Rrf2 family transcriptional regulator [Patescibacteria group bacterium]|nr:MAG: Rrf2 family transcriptional regulator [Patescibacteria group bacterium]
MVNLAEAYPESRPIQQLAKEERISVKYLERIFGILRRSELVVSHKGKSGGYTLAQKPNLLKVGEIIEALEGTIAPMGCSSSACSQKDSCASSKVWGILEKQVRKTLYGIKLNSLLK